MIVSLSGQLNALAIVEDQNAVMHGPVGDDFESRLRSFDRAKVASMLVHHVLQAGPRREAVGDANLFDSGKIDYANVEVTRVNGAGFDVILDAFGQSGKHKLKSGTAR